MATNVFVTGEKRKIPVLYWVPLYLIVKIIHIKYSIYFEVFPLYFKYNLCEVQCTHESYVRRM